MSASKTEQVIDLDNILDNTSDAIFVLDDNWCYTRVNYSGELLLRRKSATLLGRSLWSEYAELLGTPAEDQLRRSMQTGLPVKFEQFLPGLYSWHAVRAIPIKDGIILFCRDISDRVRALRDEAVREGIRRVLEDVPVAITITRGKEHRIDLQNVLSKRIFGGRSVEGMTVRNALPETEEQGFLQLLDQVYETGKPFNGKEMPLLYDRDGSGTPCKAFYDLIYQPLYETDGKVSGILHLGVDVTERLREQRLITRFAAERDATLRQLVEGVILTDEDGRITFVNEAARRLHGVARLDISPQDYANTYSLFTVDGQPYPTDDLPLSRAVLRNETVTGAQWRIRRPDASEILVEGNAQPVFDENGRKISCVLTLRQVQ